MATTISLTAASPWLFQALVHRGISYPASTSTTWSTGPFEPAQRGQKTVLLKSTQLNQPSYRDEHLYVDLRQPLVMLDSETVTLTRTQYRLLALLVEHAGQVVPRAILLMQVCGYVAGTRTRALDMHVRRLRKKLGHAGQCIATIIGGGYCFNPLHRLHHQGSSELDVLANNRTVIWAPVMVCQTCADLLAKLKLSVDLYKKAVRNVVERVGDDHEAAVEQAERLRPECLDAIDALMAHWREHHSRCRSKP